MTDTANGGAPAPGDTPTGGEPDGGAPGGGQGSWLEGLGDDLRGVAEKKGWKEPADAVQAYKHAQSLLGVQDPERSLLRLPSDPEDAEAWGKVYERLGRPAKPDDYELVDPHGYISNDPDYAGWLKQTAHQLGLSAKQAKQLSEAMSGYTHQRMERHQTDYAVQVDAEKEALRKEWGAAADQNVTIAKRAAAEFGLDDATVDALESALGFGKLMRFMHQIGTRIGEDSFVGGDALAGGAMSPAQARAELDSLKIDKEFMAALFDKRHPGHAAAVERKQRLVRYMHPED